MNSILIKVWVLGECAWGLGVLCGRCLELSFLVALSREGSEFDVYKEIADGTPNSKSSFTGRFRLSLM